MPEVHPECVASFTSESSDWPASNLLKANGFSKWQCGDIAGTTSAVEFKLKEAVKINRIDIGNNASGVVEVFVKRSAEGSDAQYKTLLPAMTMMSPAEAKSNESPNRVRLFSQDKLVAEVAEQKWDYVRVVCTQPFSKTLKYGLSFIKFYTPDETQTQPQLEAKRNAEEEDSYKPGSLFKASMVKKTQESNSSREASPKPKQPATPAPASKPSTSHKKPLTETSKPQTPSAAEKRPHSATKNTTSSSSSRKPMSGVVFSLSGYQNPLRSQLRSKALALGAQFKQDWDDRCTHLVCAFTNTPKFNQVKDEPGVEIVTDKWIIACHSAGKLLDCGPYRLVASSAPSRSKSNVNYAESDDDEEDEEKRKKKKTEDLRRPRKNNMKDDEDDEFVVPDEEEEEDEDESSDEEDASEESEGEKKKQRKPAKGHQKSPSKKRPKKQTPDPYEVDTDEEIEQKKQQKSPNDNGNKTLDDMLADLPSVFSDQHFFIHTCDKLDENEKKRLKKTIIIMDGEYHEYMRPEVNFVVTASDWNKDIFEDAIKATQGRVKFIRPKWIYQCEEANKCLSIEPYEISPS